MRKSGSPPRMRGKATVGQRLALWSRITPAHAGKSKLDRMTHIISKDHPRACGEKMSLVFYKLTRWGSPPRMRGKVRLKTCDVPTMWITPAHAGKSLLDCFYHFLRQDHPRACGEKAAASRFSRLVSGSPPRMRGKVRHRWAKKQKPGITPAHAGKSL